MYIIWAENGKWRLKDNAINFSISHSNNLICVGISKSEIGVDIEKKDVYSIRELFPDEYRDVARTERQTQKPIEFSKKFIDIIMMFNYDSNQ